MTGGLLIRPAEVSDLEQVAALAHAIFGASAWGLAHFMPHPQREVLLASAGGEVLGYAVVQWAGDEAELQSLAVASGRRRAGIGAALLEQALAFAAGRRAETMFLEVRESNLAARGFYGRFGFQECGRRPGYYHEPEEAALVLRRSVGAGA